MKNNFKYVKKTYNLNETLKKFLSLRFILFYYFFLIYWIAKMKVALVPKDMIQFIRMYLYTNLIWWFGLYLHPYKYFFYSSMWLLEDNIHVLLDPLKSVCSKTQCSWSIQYKLLWNIQNCSCKYFVALLKKNRRCYLHFQNIFCCLLSLRLPENS